MGINELYKSAHKGDFSFNALEVPNSEQITIGFGFPVIIKSKFGNSEKLNIVLKSFNILF